MYFYVDESGNTGQNLFDENQLVLYYGLLSSNLNLDAIANATLASMRSKLNVKRLHAKDLGIKGLLTIADDLLGIFKLADVRFNLYRIVKADHAVISFFDQVFDSGLNKAVAFTGYWTPLRYLLLLHTATLFDDETAKLAWQTRIELSDEKAQQQLSTVCKILLGRINSIKDPRAQELIKDALRWAMDNPAEIQFNTAHKELALQVSPNLIGFQQVMHGIAGLTEKLGKNAKSIIVDQQTEFNTAQDFLAVNYKKLKGGDFDAGLHMPEIDFNAMPEVGLTFKSSTQSAGLELVDCFLWFTKKLYENAMSLPDPLQKLYQQISKRGLTDEVSLKGIEHRWKPYFMDNTLIDPEKMEAGRKLLDELEIKRKQAFND